MYRMGPLSLACKTLEGPPNICYPKNESLWSFVMRGSIINSEVSNQNRLRGFLNSGLVFLYDNHNAPPCAAVCRKALLEIVIKSC